MKANPHAFFQIATFDTALSNDPSFKDAWGPRETRRIWEWEDSPKGAEAIKKKRIAVPSGCFVNLHRPLWNQAGLKKESTNRTCEPDFPNKKCWCFIGSPSKKQTKQQKACLFIYGHISRRKWSRYDTYGHNIYNSAWNYVSQPRLYHQQEVAPVSRTQANYDKSRLKIETC